MADTFKLISNISFVMAAVFLLASVYMFFRFNVRKIVGDLSGRNAQKSIDAMRKVNQAAEPVQINYAYKRDIAEPSAELPKQYTAELVSEDENITTLLGEDANSTTVLGDDINVTTVLGENAEGTTVLSQEELLPEEKRFKVYKEIIFIHGATSI